jgi:hypothetical protein
MGSRAFLALGGLVLAGLLSACADTPAYPISQPAPPPSAPTAAAAPAPAPQALYAPPGRDPEPASVSRYGDSDEAVCHAGPAGDPRTDQACARLRGTETPAAAPAPQPGVGTGRFGDSDDYVCNHGAADDPRTAQACARLRGPSP